MKKRLLCLFLCLVMLCSVALSSCSQTTEDEEKDNISYIASESAVTLSMWVVCEKVPSAATAAAVTRELNSITNSKFKIKLVVNFLTKDEYRTKLEETITAYEAAQAPVDDLLGVPDVEETTAVETGAVTDETETNEYGMSVVKYPELVANQVDIIYISGEDMYIDFIDKGWLASLDGQLSSSSKKLKEYISGTLLESAKYNGQTYAIPNNHAIGEYTYMLLNKDLMQKYNQHAYWEQGMIDGFYNENLYSFLNLMYQFEPDVIPVDASYEDCLQLLAHFWYFDSQDYSIQLDKFSAFGYHYQTLEDLNRGSVILGFESLFENEEFCEDFLKLNEFRFKEYFREEDDSRTQSAVKFTTGDATILQNGECEIDGVTYYPVVVGYPTASSNDIYGNMFGVYAGCEENKTLSRCMQVITYLNTNVDFRNILQYGVESTNFRLVDNNDGTTSVYPLNEDYLMDIYATGNTFIAYTQPGMSPDIWESGKVQNRNSLVDPLLGFDLTDFSLQSAVTNETVTIGAQGYNLSYTTGHSKEVLSQNEVLKAWLEKCDQQAKGIYLLRTYETQGLNKRFVYYVYNNNVENSTTFTVEDIRVMEEQYDEKNDKYVDVQVDLDFVFTYTSKSGTSATPGYELSIVTLDTKKSNVFDEVFKLNGADVSANVNKTDHEGRIAFDLLNTQYYDIDVFDTMSKASVIKNTTIIDWVLDIDKSAPSTASNYLMTYEEDLGNGTKKVSYVIYRTALEKFTELSILPTGGNKDLLVNFNFLTDEEADLGDEESDYLLCYITILANSDVNVSYVVNNNGVKENIPSRNVKTGKIDYDRCGNLDTDLVKFMQNVNDEVWRILESKFEEYNKDYQKVLTKEGATDLEKKAALNTAIQNMEELIDEFGRLFSTGDEILDHDLLVFPELYFEIDNEIFLVDDKTDKVITPTLMQFQRNVRALASYTVVEYTTITGGTEFDPDGDGKMTEPFVYFDSPYQVYYAWMQQYGFLPAGVGTEDEITDAETEEGAA